MVSARRTTEGRGVSLRAAAAQRRQQRSARNGRAIAGAAQAGSPNVMPDMLQDMLAEAGVTGSQQASRQDPSEPPPKRLKRPGERSVANRQRASPKASQQATHTNDDGKDDGVADEEEEDVEFEDIVIPKPVMQTAEMGSEDEYEDGDDSEEDDDDDDDDDDDVAFENVAPPGPSLRAVGQLHGTDGGEVLQEGQDQPRTLELNLTTEQRSSLLAIHRGRVWGGKKAAGDRRKPLTRAERLLRVDVHKVHILCLLSHVAQRNRWCNLDAVQSALRPLLTDKVVAYLNPGGHLTQFGRTESLKNGLQQLSVKFKTQFAITERGMRRALWAEDLEQLKDYELPSDIESTLDKDDFLKAAKTLQGSRDVGAQLFCALLRAAGVEARLVCSLQPLSFLTNAPTLPKAAKQTPKSKPAPSIPMIYQSTPDDDEDNEETDLATASPLRRLGHPQAAAYNIPSTATRTPPRRKQVQNPTSGASMPHVVRGESNFPVYWVEILDVAHQKWQPVDPLVTCSQWRPGKLEPPALDRKNQMSYVIAFNDDGSAKDVTRRYAKAYNAKTRRARVDGLTEQNGAAATWTPTATAAAASAAAAAAASSSTPTKKRPLTNDRWLRRAMRRYRTQYESDIDQIEDAELGGIESREPMPRNVADFQHHPVYALARHLRRHEVLVPKATSVGTVSAGSKAPLERIYRRKDVRIAYSADKWYRLGQLVMPNEIPVKWLPKPAKKKGGAFGSDDDDDDGNDGNGGLGSRGKPADDLFGDDEDMEAAARYGMTFEPAGTPLFTPEQTELYQAPPVVNGRIPKNKFGNIDIYVPSMVPAGGVHIADPNAGRAAFMLGVDYAPALTGFRFEGRKGTAVLHGAVVAAEHEDAVRAVLAGLADQEAEAEAARRARVALRVWSAFLRGLRIRHRIRMAAEDRGEDVDEDEDDIDVDAEEPANMETEAAAAAKTRTKAKRRTPPRRTIPHNFEEDDDDDDDDGGGFVPEEDEGGGFLPEEGDGGGFIHERAVAPLYHSDTGEGGGFIPGDGNSVTTNNEDGAGGFMPETSSHRAAQDDDQGGGFVPEDEDDGPAANNANDDDYENAMADAQSDVTEEYDMLMDDDDSTGGGFLLE